jgi:hypothetical protein
MTDQTRPKPPTGVTSASDREVEIAFAGPAFFANKFYVTGIGPNVRLAFAEQANANSTPVFRTAVAMSAADLLQLGKAIEQMAKVMQVVEVRPNKPNA